MKDSQRIYGTRPQVQAGAIAMKHKYNRMMNEISIMLENRGGHMSVDDFLKAHAYGEASPTLQALHSALKRRVETGDATLNQEAFA